MKKVLPAFVLAALVFQTPARAQRDTSDLKAYARQVELSISPLVKDADFAPLTWSPQFVWKSDEYKGVALPAESIEQVNGIYGVRAARAILYHGSPLSPGVYGDSTLRVLKPGSAVLNQDEAQAIASTFLQRHFAWFYQRDAKTVLTAKPASFNGIFEFEWQQYGEDEMPAGRLWCQVRAIDGRIMGFSAGEPRGVWEHRIKPSEAFRILVEHASKGGTVKDIEVTGWHPGGGPEGNYYAIGLKGRRISDNAAVRIGGSIDAMTGAVRGHAIEGWTRYYEKDAEMVEDRLPVWTKKGLVFSSNRRLAGLPSWVPARPQALLREADGRISYLTCDLGRAPRALTGLPSSSWVGMERRGGIYGFDIDTGEYRSLDQTRRSSFFTSFDATGRWAVKCGSIQHSKEDLHLYSNKAGGTQLVLQSNAAVPGGPQKTMFSPDGKRIYFVYLQYSKRGYMHSLGYVNFGDMAKKGGPKARSYTVTDSIPAPVERMSASADGSRILLQTERGLCFVNVKDGKLTRLRFNGLKDPARPGATLSRIEDGWAGPGNDHVTFSAQVNFGKGKRERRIFYCGFDGSGLKSLTWPTAATISARDFPATEGTPYDLTRKWVLEELRADRERALGG